MLRSSWRCLSDHGVELGAGARVGRVVATGSDHAVAVHQPGLARFRIACDRKSIAESHFRRVHVAVGQSGEGHPRCNVAFEFRHDGGLGLAERTRRVRGMFGFGCGVAPLRHEAVLHAQDRECVPIVLVRQRADVLGVQRRIGRSKLDHHPPFRQIHVQRVVGIERAPVGRSGCIQHLLHRRRRFRGRRGGSRRYRCSGQKGCRDCSQHGMDFHGDVAMVGGFGHRSRISIRMDADQIRFSSGLIRVRASSVAARR